MKHFYERNANVAQIRVECAHQLASLKLTRNFQGGPVKFFQAFQNIYLDLKAATGENVPDEEKIGTLSASIDNDRFEAEKSVLLNIAQQMGKQITYNDYIQAFMTLAECLTPKHCEVRSQDAQGWGRGGRGGRGGRSRG